MYQKFKTTENVRKMTKQLNNKQSNPNLIDVLNHHYSDFFSIPFKDKNICFLIL